MIDKLNIFLNKKILVYGLGKSGIASYKFLKGKSKADLAPTTNLILFSIIPFHITTNRR